jgi:hypothetical protein
MFAIGLAIYLSLGILNSVTAAEPLRIAKELSKTKFKDWKYGSSAAKMQIDCVQFVLATLEECTQTTFNEEFRNAVLINNMSKAELVPQNLAKLVEEGDPRTKGVQTALITAKLGTEVQPDQARPGDFIQYWMKKKDGSWFGHSGILNEVSQKNGKPEATIFGSHRSEGGIAVSTFKLKLIGAPEERRIYLVRLKSD